MDFEQIISYSIGGLAMSLVMAFLNKGASKNISGNHIGEFELRMNRLYQFLGFFCLGIAAITIFATIYLQEEEILFIVICVLLFFVVLGLPCLLFYNNHKLIFNDERIIVQSWTKKLQKISWREIEEISFNKFSGYLKIKGANKEMAIHQHIVGLKQFTNKMEQRTGRNVAEL